MRNKTKRLGALGATALVALVVIGPAAGMANAATTTTGGGGTTTTLPPQKPVHSQGNNNNDCISALDPPVSAGGPTKIGVTISTDTFPQPHEGDPISLTNTQLKISVPATLLQLGVDTGIISDGQNIPSTVKLVIQGTNTTQKTHTFNISSTVTVHVVNGQAQPLNTTAPLPNTSWTPVSKEKDVHFSEKSMVIVSTIDATSTLGIIITATFTCNPSGGGTDFTALGGISAPATTTTVTTTTTATTVAPTTPVTPAAATTSELPRTGSSTGLLLALGIALLSAGAFALRATGRRAARQRP